MKLKQYFNEARNYIVGNLRWFCYRYMPWFIRSYVVEQFEYRKEACKECANSYETRCCGCSVPAVFLSFKECRLGKYPELLNKKEWENFKRRKQQWETLVSIYPSGENELNNIGLKVNKYYHVIIDIVDGAYTKEQLDALSLYRKSQFLKIQDSNPEIILDHD